MKRYPLLVVIALFFSVSSTAQHRDLSQQYNERPITKEALVKDIDAYRDGIDKNHTDPYTFIKKKEFFDKIEQVKSAAGSYNEDELYVKLLQINALLHDGHTSIYRLTKEIFPFTCHWYKEGIFIIATDDDNRKYYHARIIAVNDIPIEEVAKRIATIIPDTATSYIKSRVPNLIIDPIILHGLNIISDAHKVSYTVVTPKNETLKVSPFVMDTRDLNQLTGYKQDNFLRSSVKGKYWFKYIDSEKCVYFNYSSCKDDGTFDHVIDALEKTIDEKEPRRIVIDIRYNSGGNSSLLRPFIDYLSKSSLNKKGRIYVLLGRKTYSSAVLNALALKRQTNAIFVGEETGGTIDHFGEQKSFVLPETKMTVYYSTRFFSSYEKYPGSLYPDVRIIETFKEYDNNIDSVLDYAIGH